ncbi:MAG: hypothetical protein J1F28_08905, partial [Oscillospiraceae bacterium]|nr:hypothetical protein [Oscillospiraceae bacterium]
ISLYSSKNKSSRDNARDALGAGLALLSNHYKKDYFDNISLLKTFFKICPHHKPEPRERSTV